MKIPSLPTGKTRWIVITAVAIAVGGLLAFWLLHDRGNHGALQSRRAAPVWQRRHPRS